MDVYELNSPVRVKRDNVENELGDLCTAKAFKAKNIACVVSQEGTFSSVLYGLEKLGFEVACSSSLEATFTTVSEDPELWAMIIVRLDQPVDEKGLENYVRLIRTMDVRIPILVMVAHGKTPASTTCPNIYSDCVVGEPTSLAQLSAALKISVEANRRWGSRFDDYRRDAINKLCRPLRKSST